MARVMGPTPPGTGVMYDAFVDDVREALESGMDAHIAKPVQVDTLKSTIQQVLDSRMEQLDGPREAGNK